MRRGEGYGSPWWARIYDQWNEHGDRARWRDADLWFCRRQLAGVDGPVLEAACGTGSILLPLLADGFDMYGFDASEPMLARLHAKAANAGIDTTGRVRQQDMTNFGWEQTFAAITVPANSFLLLPTEHAQATFLRACHAHLAPGGVLLLNHFIPTPDNLREHAVVPPVEQDFGRFVHPQTAKPIEVTFTRVCDLQAQTEDYTWFFAHDGQITSVPMRARWIEVEQLAGLLRDTGFDGWEVTGSADGEPYVASTTQLTTPHWRIERG